MWFFVGVSSCNGRIGDGDWTDLVEIPLLKTASFVCGGLDNVQQ